MDIVELQDSPALFTGAKLQCPQLCTARDNEPCHIVAQLPVWNEFLCQACIQLREDVPGQLCLIFRDYYQFISNGEIQIQYAFNLVNCILKMHRCVVVLDINYFLDLKSFERLVCLGSNMYNSLKILRLRDIGAPLLLQNISMAIPQLSKLEELNVELCKLSGGFIEAVCSLLSTSSSLKRLCLPDYNMNRMEAEALYNALALNTQLEELCVHTSFLLPGTVDCCVKFTQYLASSTTLKTLELYAARQRSSRVLEPVIRALTRSGTLLNITLDYFYVDRRGARAIEKFLSKNTLVKIFNLRDCQWYGKNNLWPEYENTRYDTSDMGSLSQRIMPWISILRKNRSLQQLTLNLAPFTPTECNAFFAELIKSTTIQKIIIEDIDLYCSRRGRRYACPITFPAKRSALLYRPHLMVAECRQLSDLKLGFYEADDSTWFERTVLALTGCRHITTLSLDLRFLFEERMLSPVCTYIAETSVLRELCIKLPLFLPSYFPDTSIGRAAIMGALQQNSTLRKLSLSNYGFYKDEVVFLANIVRSSRVIHTFVLDSCADEVEKFLQFLSLNFSQNHTLVSLEFYTGRLRVTPSYFVVKDIVRRNHDLVSCAADFVMGNRSRRCCEALECVAGNPALVDRLSEIFFLDEQEAVESVSQSLDHIRGVVEFLRYAGVVMSRLSFYEKPYGCAWLDTIDEYSWLSVRRYLRVADVLRTPN